MAAITKPQRTDHGPQPAAPRRRRISVLGATGSVGTNTLDLVARQRDAYELVALTAHSNVAVLIEQARRLRPALAVVGEEAHYQTLKDGLAGTDIAVAAGASAVAAAAAEPADWVMAAIVGAAGLRPTLQAIGQGATVALANKESLVCAGKLVMDLAQARQATLLPVDSEHNAVFQVFDFARPERVSRVILTASGGPFRTWTREAMAQATPRQAVKHPNWSMGAKISVDSATMMNKGLELIEAFHLFPIEEQQIDILVHPQSVVHSLVEYVDGSVLAQLGTPDMRTPIGYALGWPDRVATPSPRLDLAALGALTFEAPDPQRFPALALARAALRAGDAATTVLNAANEIAVAAYLAGHIGFLDIVAIVDQCLQRGAGGEVDSLEAILAVDGQARRTAQAIIAARN
ncbi:MAG: 1-deoxy-D-xylulose-5-phosphate reductoisomerase [Alphaproteobacteria bacterium]|nr:MAG: 1-deoxy-D-xylulose-5-phosphate reductoisomerase [Alphaproteobacteria bacterium]